MENEIATDLDQLVEMHKIGTIDRNDHADTYYLLVRFDDDFPPDDDAHNWFLSKVFYDTDRIGGWFCNQVTLTQHPWHQNQLIAIAHHRQNV